MKLALIIISLFISTVVFPGPVKMSDQISIALKTGNSKELAKFFNSTIDLAVMDEEDVYSKAQAELILKDFFSDHPPTDFKVIHQGTSQSGLQYAIGSLTTKKHNFRVSIYLKSSNNKEHIQQLRIDLEE